MTLLEFTRGVNRYLFACAEGQAVTDEELGREFEEKVLASCYETLGCSPEISDRELKRKFRELCQEYHPNRLAGQENSRRYRQAGRGEVPGDSKRLRGRGDIPELIPVSPYHSRPWSYGNQRIPRRLWETAKEEVADEKVPFGRSDCRGGGHCSYDAASDSIRVLHVCHPFFTAIFLISSRAVSRYGSMIPS